MNLIDLMRSVNIAGLTLPELREVLTHNHPSINVRSDSNGAIVLSNRAIVKCVNNYYTNPRKQAKKPSGVNICHTVHGNFDIVGVPANHCSSCHLMCLNKRDRGELSLIVKKSSSKRRK